MKRTAIMIAATALVSIPAWANTVAGTIVSIDPQAHQMVLDDGKTYNVARNVTLAGLRPGDKVSVNAQLENGANMIDRVEQTGTPFVGSQPSTPFVGSQPPAPSAQPSTPGAPSNAASLAPPAPQQ